MTEASRRRRRRHATAHKALHPHRSARAFWDEKAQVGFIFSMKKGRSLPELGASSRIGLRVRENRGLAGCGTRLFHDQLKDHFAVSVKLS